MTPILINVYYFFSFKKLSTYSKNFTGRKPVAKRFFFIESLFMLRESSASLSMLKHHLRIILWFWAGILSDVVL